MIKVMSIAQDGIVDGTGLRATIFFSGCPHECKGCHNPESWDINNGKCYSVDEIIKIIESNPIIKGVTLSGGEPLYQSKQILPLVKKLKGLGYNIWIYSGYTLDQIKLDTCKWDVVKRCDTLVDGKYDEGLRDLTLDFRGSSNQRIIKI